MDPERDLDDLALARVLDGLGPDPDADPAEVAAHERATADVDAIARALGLIGDTLGSEPPAAAAGAVTPLEDVAFEEAMAPASGVVVPLRRRHSARALLGAAASIVAIGLGLVVVLHHDGGSGSSTSASQAPAGAEQSRSADSDNGSVMQAPAAPAAAAPAAAPAAAADSAGSASTAAGSAPAAKAAPAPKSAARVPAFGTVAACARGIVLGKVVSITGSGGQYQLVLSVSEWISPSSGPTTVTYAVGSNYAGNDSTAKKLTAGQQRVFIVPQDPTAEILAYVDSVNLRSRIAQAQASGQSCG